MADPPARAVPASRGDRRLYLPALGSGCRHCIIMSLTACAALWPAYFGEANDRLAPYMTAGNFPRVLKPKGHLVFVEWEARPEERVGKRTLAEVKRDIEALYQPVELAGYERVACGYAAALYSAYAVYRSTGA